MEKPDGNKTQSGLSIKLFFQILKDGEAGFIVFPALGLETLAPDTRQELFRHLAAHVMTHDPAAHGEKVRVVNNIFRFHP